ncbi:hypothetical protein BOX15_Mlig034230g3 [Macrostomum lignano]|uniref:Uncharacterized protein n=2 Tax=Macrostomum lignano TaxID=282301 RepID=A0A267DZ47_9PLAT|nr:hypothetical protein BOX15_Mlig004556g1 [Macrostomum lignano]PAA57627.1 hypothetical protein BOX15_Mlig034230g2 [Macrostomum lignano]PAA62353.1 hypothetical protein BOX15_Mlig034230g1 [Macrostomum lignano]PAA92806.1 hypothetical protein BOX15_Mlig034230g3 [Macrostomum lignano]
MRFIELEEDRTCCFKYITMLCRMAGLVVVVCLYIMMISILTVEKYHTINGWYLLGITVLLTFLESVWLFDKCNCCDDMSCCCMIWRAIKWIDCWRKTILYIALPIPLFLRNNDQSSSVLKAVLSGTLILGLALLYFIKSFRNASFAKAKGRSYMDLQAQAALASQQAMPMPSAMPAPQPVMQQQQPMMPPPSQNTPLTSAGSTGSSPPTSYGPTSGEGSGGGQPTNN